jgi:glycosyltransferase involved in cell wall biosynthesis
LKILIDARVASDHFTGIGRYAFGLVRHLPPALAAHEFVAARNPAVSDTRFDWAALSARPNVRIVECAGTGLGAADVIAFAALVRRERPDFVHAPYFTAALGHGVPTVVTLHDFIPFDAPRSGPVGRLTRWGLEHAVRRAAHVVTPSRAIRDEGIRRLELARARVTAIPPGIQSPGDGPLPAPLRPGEPYNL